MPGKSGACGIQAPAQPGSFAANHAQVKVSLPAGSPAKSEDRAVAPFGYEPRHPKLSFETRKLFCWSRKSGTSAEARKMKAIGRLTPG